MKLVTLTKVMFPQTITNCFSEGWYRCGQIARLTVNLFCTCDSEPGYLTYLVAAAVLAAVAEKGGKLRDHGRETPDSNLEQVKTYFRVKLFFKRFSNKK